ncbi:MAG TPA: SPOR domain-containing protein [Pyrinomonadaceae bacterium]|nr:SPOR domain-containing protein [Pyrinomonadaceae bacterium]
MQIICPNCGSKSPIEAGSLFTQTRIVCARCAVEFAAELSDEQPANAPASAAADERGIELFRAAEVTPFSHARPVQVTEAPAAPAADGLPAPVSYVYEVLSLPEEALLSGEAATETPAADADHANVLEDIFAAWNQSREAKSEAVAPPAESTAAADDYVTSPLDPVYEASLREERLPETELTRKPSAEVFESAGGRPAAEAAVEAAEDDDEREPAHAPFADVSIPPQVAAQSFDTSLDTYGLGVRLMRVSPLWLLISGLSFISFVVFCNWFFVPANLAQADPSRRASLRNEATNRSTASEASSAVAVNESPGARPSGSTQPAEAEVVNAPVKVEGPAPAPTAPPATPAPTARPAATPNAEQPKPAEAVSQPAPAGKFAVQVGSYSSPAEAEGRAAKLRSAGQAVRVAEVEIPKRGKWYRVYVGGFGSRGEAESHGKSLRERGLAESYIATEAQ